MEQNLDTKLTRIENTINIMKNNLGLPENEVIENLATATNLHTLANLFIQENEPETKDGIWIKTDNSTHPYDVVKIDQNIIIPGKWRFDTKPLVVDENNNSIILNSNPSEFKSQLMRVCVVNNEVYTLTKMVSIVNPGELIKVDMNTGKTTVVHQFGYNSSLNNGHVFAAKHYVCITDYDRGFYLFDTITKTMEYVNLAEGVGKPSDYTRTKVGCYSEYDNCIYTHGYSYGIIRYNLDTKECQSVFTSTISSRFSTDILVSMGQQILAIGPDPYLFDIPTDKGTYQSHLANAAQCQMINMPNDYIYAYTPGQANSYYYATIKSAVKIDKNTLTVIDIRDDFVDADLAKILGGLVFYNNCLNIFVGDNGTSEMKTTYLLKKDCSTVQYDKNMIVIMQSPITNSALQTALWTYPCLDGRMCQSFYDVYYYNKETGFDFTLPTYYGNGTEWIKFKN